MKVLKIVVFLACFGAAFSVLSKSDKEAKQTRQKAKPKKSSETVRKQFERDDDTKKQLLAVEAELQNERPINKLPSVLGFVTPWNSVGYDVAKFAAKKFTHISPVWLQINEAVVDELPTCTVAGTHDIDHGWVADVRKNNPNVLIVPRVLFDRWQPGLESLFFTQGHSQRCAMALVEFLQRNDFDGAVLEIWLQMRALARETEESYLIEVITDFASEFQRAGLQLVIPIHLPLEMSGSPTNIISDYAIVELTRVVDYILLMGYDFRSPPPNPIGPVPWLRLNLDYITSGLEAIPGALEKLMLSISYYGYKFDPKPTPQTMRDFLATLKANPSLVVEWDTFSFENLLRRSGGIHGYLPTVRSIRERISLAESYNIGLAIWELGQGRNDFTMAI